MENVNIKDDDNYDAENLPKYDWATNFSGSDGSTLLHAAIKAERKNFIYKYFDEGGNVDCLDKEGNTPLTLALTCSRKNLQILDLLLTKKPSFKVISVRKAFFNLLKSNFVPSNYGEIHLIEYDTSYYRDDRNVIMTIIQNGFSVQETDNYIEPGALWNSIVLHLEEFASLIIKYNPDLSKHLLVWHEAYSTFFPKRTKYEDGIFNILKSLRDKYIDVKDRKSVILHDSQYKTDINFVLLSKAAVGSSKSTEFKFEPYRFYENTESDSDEEDPNVFNEEYDSDDYTQPSILNEELLIQINDLQYE